MGRWRTHGRRRTLEKALWGGLAGCLLASAVASAQEPLRGPDIVIITVDTLRFDRVSANGYSRPTTPHIDALLAKGVRFTDARVPEPLTAPAMTSMRPRGRSWGSAGVMVRRDAIASPARRAPGVSPAGYRSREIPLSRSRLAMSSADRERD